MVRYRAVQGRQEKYCTMHVLSAATRRLLAVDAAVDLLHGVGELELMDDLTFAGCDAPGIFALDDANHLLGQLHMTLLGNLAVVDDVDGDAGVQVAQNVQVNVHMGADLDDILLAHLGAVSILDQGHSAVQLVQIQHIVDVHAVAGGDVV